MPEIIQLTRWFVGCMVSSRLLGWVVLLIFSSGTSLKRVRKAFTSLWSRVPWKPAVSILRLYKSSRRLPSRFRYSSFNPSDTESSCSWSGTVSFWERVSTVRSSIQKRGLTFLSSNQIWSCCRWHGRGRHLVWSPTGFASRTKPEKINNTVHILKFYFNYFISTYGSTPCENIQNY